MNSDSNTNNDSANITDESNSNSDELHCRVCGQQFDDMAKMQRHTMEHMDKGDIPSQDIENK